LLGGLLLKIVGQLSAGLALERRLETGTADATTVGHDLVGKIGPKP